MLANDSNPTKRPSAESAGKSLNAITLDAVCRDADPLGLAGLPIADEDVVLPVGVARDKVAGARAESDEAPVGRDSGTPLLESLWMPPVPTLTRSVVPACRSRTKTSRSWFVSPGTRLVAYDAKATKRPSLEIANPLPPISSVGLRAALPDAHALGPVCPPVEDEYIIHAVGVAPHEVGGERV